ncbi:MAG TPA: rhomboid family intramembrane serine protease, partial [Candidatus Saccharimonadia bacterium]|nr:rhomboid family intramembrane serine protease [Candidatus Saccharimonadia bacterium]
MTITLALIAVTCAVSFLGFNQPRVIEQLILWPPALKRGEYWRLASYGLVHADFGHLAFNMITLYFFGRAMEPVFVGLIGQAGYLAFYLGALVVSILPT